MSDELAQLWNEQQTAPFPLTCSTVEFKGVTLLQMDVALGRYLTSCLGRDGIPRPLTQEELVQLREAEQKLTRALLELPLDPGGRQYFERLQKIARWITK